MTIEPTFSSGTLPMFRLRVWILGIFFFLAATPFELTQSGYVYLIKAFSLGVIISYAVIMRGARIGLIHPAVGITLIILFLTNLFSWTDRVVVASACILLGAALGQARSKRWDRDFYAIVSLFISVHFAALIFSAASFYLAEKVLDLHGLIFPEASRAEAYHGIGRLSGLHTEPGTYSQWTLVSVYLLALLRGKLLTIWHALIASSVLLTFSLWGVLALSIFVLTFAVEAALTKGLTGKLKSILGVVALLISGAFVLSAISPEIRQVAVDFLQQKVSLETDSGIDKLRASQFFIDNLTTVLIIGQPLQPGFCPNCISPQDAGIGQNAIFYFGLLFFVVLLLVLGVTAATRWGAAFVLPLLIIFSWKANIYEPLLWIIIGYILRGPSKFRFDALDKSTFYSNIRKTSPL